MITQPAVMRMALAPPAGSCGQTPPEASRVSASPASVETADTSAVVLSVCLGAVLLEGGARGA